MGGRPHLDGFTTDACEGEGQRVHMLPSLLRRPEAMLTDETAYPLLPVDHQRVPR